MKKILIVGGNLKEENQSFSTAGIQHTQKALKIVWHILQIN